MSGFAQIIIESDCFIDHAMSDLFLADRFALFIQNGNIEFGTNCSFSTAIFRARYSSFARVVNGTWSGKTDSSLGYTARIDANSVLDTASNSLAGLPGNGSNSGVGGAIV